MNSSENKIGGARNVANSGENISMSKSSGKQRLKSLIESKAYSFNKDLEEVDDWDRNSTHNTNTIKIEANSDHG